MNVTTLSTTIAAAGGAITAIAVAWATSKTALAKLGKAQSMEVIELLTKSKENWKEQAEFAQLERKTSDERHEKILAEYRAKIDVFTAQATKLTEEISALKLEIQDLKGRTDVTPFMDFQQSWYKESAAAQEQTISFLNTLAPILERVVIILSKLEVLKSGG